MSVRPLLVLAAAVLSIGQDADAQRLTYSFGDEKELLNDKFYRNEQADGTALPLVVYNAGINNAETKGLVWGLDLRSITQQLYRFDMHSMANAEPLPVSIRFEWSEMEWSNDDTLVHMGDNVFVEDVFTSDFVFTRIKKGDIEQPVELYSHAMTRLPDSNWIATSFENELVLLPMLSNGLRDPGRDPVVVTRLNLPQDNPMAGVFTFPSIDQNMESLLFTLENRAGSPTETDTYLLTGLADIVNAPNPTDDYYQPNAPTSLNDPRIKHIRSAVSHTNSIGTFSRDGSIVFTNEDFTNIYDPNNFFESLTTADFDIVITPLDGTGDQRIERPLNQSNVQLLPNSGLFTYIGAVNDQNNTHLFLTTVVTCNDLDEKVSRSSDGDMRTAEEMVVRDVSGTRMYLPADLKLLTEQNPIICVSTLINPVPGNELPAQPLIATRRRSVFIPVTRLFEPTTMAFDRGVEVAIEYADRQLGAHEDEIVVYRKNDTTGRYQKLDAAFFDTISVDPVRNVVKFKTDRLGIYGVGYESEFSTILWGRIVITVSLVGIILAAFAYHVRLRLRAATGR